VQIPSNSTSGCGDADGSLGGGAGRGARLNDLPAGDGFDDVAGDAATHELRDDSSHDGMLLRG
jgi:hypothetical protein